MAVSVPNTFTANTKIQSAQVNANNTALLALCPITALGDMLYASSTTAMSRLAGNTTTTKKFLTQTGDGANSAAPGWNTLSYSDVSSLLPQGSNGLLNLGLSVSVATNALTVALKQSDGSTDPAAAPSDVKIGFRSSTLTSGAYSVRSATAAASLTVASGATLGTTNGGIHYLYVYALDNAGTIELAIAGMAIFDEGKVWSTTALSGASNSASTLYSTTGRTSKAIRLIGRIRISEATAGTWATSPTEVSTVPFPIVTQPTLQKFTSAGSGTYTTPTSPNVPLYLRVRMVGGGGGGGGLAAGSSNGGAGGDTVFGAATAKGGNLGTSAGIGGAVTTGSTLGGYNGTLIEGGAGGMPGGSVANTCGGHGGSSFFGGAGQGGYPGTTDATNAAANSGSGGGGAQNAGASGAGAGGAGAYIEAIIASPAATYSYTVGAFGTAGTGTRVGGAGGLGYIEVWEYYQ